MDVVRPSFEVERASRAPPGLLLTRAEWLPANPVGGTRLMSRAWFERGGSIITASDDYVADVYCENGTITAIGKDLPSHRYQADRTIDAAGQRVRRHTIWAHGTGA